MVGSPEEDAVCWEEKSALGRLKCSAKNGHRVERVDAVSTFGVKHGVRLMEPPGVPHVADTLGGEREQYRRRNPLLTGE